MTSIAGTSAMSRTCWVTASRASWLSGLGQLDPQRDEAVYDHRNIHADIVIVGAGPAGLAAAREAAASDARVVLIDEDSELGGSLLDERDTEIDLALITSQPNGRRPRCGGRPRADRHWGNRLALMGIGWTRR